MMICVIRTGMMTMMMLIHGGDDDDGDADDDDGEKVEDAVDVDEDGDIER